MSSDLGRAGGFRSRIHSGTGTFQLEKQNEDFFSAALLVTVPDP
jgi:hypothetical protein